ncbi:protein mono-ADP-ribosyltransferase PARP6-like [Mercenaria mercenaria]|uniref:protein mono-ADP-ribosyltransferase PARP6-like n=1 Tax=Mercenaria mercenaria TaxID=6596 RepID=UPI00234F46B1|nr:protein mono-ADP-ribosyltransferase PARP6-like [Mercenaria mercenaria]
MDELKPPGVSRSVSCESGASNYTDAMSSFEDDEDEIFDCEYICDVPFIPSEDQNEVVMNPHLYRDMENLIFMYSEKSVQYRLFESIDEIDVELHIPLGFLDDVTADAWKVLRTEPLVVRLHLSLSRYLESSNPPKVEVFQPSKKEGFGFGSQVRKFLESFLYKEWHHLQEDHQKCLEAEEKMKKSQSAPLSLKPETPMTDIISEIVRDEAIAKLVNLGFEPDLARNALIITHGNIEEATRLILESPHECTEENIHNKVSVETNSEVKPSTSDSTPSVTESKKTAYTYRSISQMSEDENVFQLGDLDLYGDTPVKMPKNEKEKEKTEKPVRTGIKRQLSHPTILNKLKRMFPGLTRTTSVMHEYSSPGMLEDLNLMPLSTLDGKNAKNIPSIADGFLVQVFRYVRQRIPTMNEYCVICDEPHVFQNGAMLKPAVCSRELCVFAFQTLGVMADAAEDIATGAEVVDLLINMTRAASKSGRKNVIFDPFPTVVDPKDPCNLLFTPKNPDYNMVATVIEAIPPMSEMSCMTSSLKQKLDEKNPSVYPLIQWIITSNRSHIVKLPSEKQLDFMHTPHQFLLLSSPPAKEAAFQEAKKRHGSTFAFHGSSIENWHSIIRQGLMNASGTKLQVNGAAYGKGIYLSPHVSTSMGYSRMGYGSHNVKKNKAKGDGRSRFLVSSNITCIALCEVITTPLKKNNSIWVCPEPDHVCTRFFFVYEDGQVGDSSIDTQNAKYLQPIKEACGYKM